MFRSFCATLAFKTSGVARPILLTAAAAGMARRALYFIYDPEEVTTERGRAAEGRQQML